jgi:hypothetical protein
MLWRGLPRAPERSVPRWTAGVYGSGLRPPSSAIEHEERLHDTLTTSSQHARRKPHSANYSAVRATESASPHYAMPGRPQERRGAASWVRGVEQCARGSASAGNATAGAATRNTHLQASASAAPRLDRRPGVSARRGESMRPREQQRAARRRAPQELLGSHRAVWRAHRPRRQFSAAPRWSGGKSTNSGSPPRALRERAAAQRATE